MGKFTQFAKFSLYILLLVLAVVLWIFLLLLAIALISMPASAQTVATPTPPPAIEATRQAAQAQLDAARADMAEADRRDAQAAEMRRNAEAQQASAAQALSDARAAVVAQNTAAYAEAIGRAEGDLTALRGSVDGLTQLNAQSGVTVRLQAAQIVSLTLEVQALRTDKATLSAAYAATVALAAEAEQASGNTSPLVWFVALAVIGGAGIALIVVLGRKQTIQAAPVAWDVDAG